MIKVKTNTTEIKALGKYLKACIIEKAKTNDMVKEYFIASAIDQLIKKINKKVFVHENNGSYLPTVLTLKIEYAELLALTIYFKRYEVFPFLLKLERDILNKVPSQIIDVLKNGNSPEGTVSFLEYFQSLLSEF